MTFALLRGTCALRSGSLRAFWMLGLEGKGICKFLAGVIFWGFGHLRSLESLLIFSGCGGSWYRICWTFRSLWSCHWPASTSQVFRWARPGPLDLLCKISRVSWRGFRWSGLRFASIGSTFPVLLCFAAATVSLLWWRSHTHDFLVRGVAVSTSWVGGWTKFLHNFW